MKETMVKLSKGAWKLINIPFLALEGKYSGITARYCVDNLTNQTEYIYQYFRFKKNNDCESEYIESFSKVGIVIQGQPILKDDFTLNTALMYKRFFPGVKVVISTWEEVSPDFFVKCRSHGIDVIKKKTPTEKGAGNLNCQLLSSLSGVRFLKEQGVQYVAKTRTDQRFNSSNWLDYVMTLIKIFPVKGDCQKTRLVFMESNGTYKYIAFHVCDFFAFGSIDDMERLYSIPLDKRENDFFAKNAEEIRRCKEKLKKFERREYFSGISYKKYGEELLKWNIAEFYMLYSYVHNNIESDLSEDNLLIRYWKYLEEYAIIVDSFQMQFYWSKYRRKYELQSKYDKEGKLDFAGWLKLYKNILH
ncbi:MAG: WavE lipopolysaccharide synthesis family protein [Eubacteriales bacterium]|nr:WavE lipopolysaccharide synthesis family protein [Eubacteriales bacterium]